MTDLTKHTQLPTVQAIYQWYEDQRQRHRPHLGASQIGHHCDRFLWYQFRWCESPNFPGRVLRLFDHGDKEEERIVRDLRRIGVTVYEVDPETGKQFTFSACGGHFGLSLDGVGQGFQESSRWHNLEFKTANDKKFKELKGKGVKEWNQQYWAQVQVGMELAGLDRTYHFTVNKNDDDMYGERIKLRQSEADHYLNRAERVIFSESPLERVSERPDWYQCKFCDMYEICHGDRVAEVNCRTCVHSTPERDGTWSCAKHGKTLTTKEQRAGCNSHLMRPDLVPYAKATDAGDDWVEYDDGAFYNHVSGSNAGRHCYTSAEMRAADRLPAEKEAEDARQRFGGAVDGTP